LCQYWISRKYLVVQSKNNMSVSTICTDNEKDAAVSTSDVFFEISRKTNDLSSIEYLKTLLDILTEHLQMEFGSIYEVIREGQYSLVNLVDSHVKNNTLQINSLSNSALTFLMQERCYAYSSDDAPDDNIIRPAAPELNSLLSLCLPDAEKKTIGLLVFASSYTKKVSDEDKKLIELFSSRIGVELERFRLQFSLEYANDQSRYISDLSRDMIWNIDADGIYTYVNRACFEIYGYEPEDMLGQHYSSFIHKSMLDEFNKLIEKNKKDDDVHKLITQHQSRNGFPVKLICTTKALRDRNGELTGVTGTSTDITEFIRSQLLFKSNNELFSSVLSRLPVIFLRINEDAKIIDIRGRGLGRLSVKDHDWVDKSVYGLFKGKDKEINSVLAGDTVSFEISGTADGKFWAFFVSIFFDSWTGFGAIGFCVDITEQKLNEEKLEKLLNEKRELNQRLVTIQEEERSNLARELHDEFGQSITAVKSLAKAITAFSGDQYSETRSLSNSIVDLSGKLYEVVNDMMRRLRPEILDTLGLKPAIKNCVERSQLEIEGIKCNTNFSGDFSSLDEVVTITVYRIVQECLTNISKYAMASNVDIEISRKIIKGQERRQRNVYPDQKATNVEMSVRDVLTITITDDGVGMNVEEALKKKEHRNRMGLIGIEERLIALDGSLNIISKPYEGVRIEATIELSVTDIVPKQEKIKSKEAL